MKNSQMLLKEGRGLLKISNFAQKFFIAFIFSFLATILLCGVLRERVSEYFAVSGSSMILNVMMVLNYALLFVGAFWLPCYFFGMIFIGLGQIAENTDSNSNTPESVAPSACQAPKKSADVSAQLLNGLSAALNEQNEEDRIKRLQETKQLLKNPKEQQLIQKILDAPRTKMPAILQELYTKFNQGS